MIATAQHGALRTVEIHGKGILPRESAVTKVRKLTVINRVGRAEFWLWKTEMEFVFLLGALAGRGLVCYHLTPAVRGSNSFTPALLFLITGNRSPA